MTTQPEGTRPQGRPEEPEVSGHRFYSDENLKHDVEPVADDDTAGHRFFSDENLKHDVQPVADEARPADTQPFNG